MMLRHRFTDLLTRHVHNLRMHGDRATGCCPFHDDRSPSFSAHLVLGGWKCFGCGRKGGVKAFAELVGEPWTPPHSALSRSERRRFAVVAARRQAEEQSRRVLDQRATAQHEQLCAQDRDAYTQAGCAADLLSVFHRWPTFAEEFPDLVEQAEHEYAAAQDALAILTPQLDGEVEVI